MRASSSSRLRVFDGTPFSGTSSFDNKNVGTGKTVTTSGVSLTGTDAGNYHLASDTATDATAVINARPLTITVTLNT